MLFRSYTITRLGHSVSNNDWVTKIEAQYLLLDEASDTLREVIDYENIQIVANPGTDPVTGQPASPVVTGTTTSAPPANQTPPGKGDWNTLNSTLSSISNQGSAAWKETGANPLILNTYKEVGNPQSSDQTAWCAAFVGYVLKTSGLSYLKNNLSSLAYAKYGQEVPINDSSKWRKWDIAVWKHANKPGQGHVSFITGVTKSGITVIEPTSAFGGNQGNTVRTSKYPYRGGDMVLIAVRRGGWTPPTTPLPGASGEEGGSTY